MGLTQKRIQKLNTPGRYSDGHQLYLQVQSPTNKSWLFRYTFGGRERFMGLGPLHTIDLEEARERARQARKTLLDGADPLAVRAAEAGRRALEAARTITFEAESLLRKPRSQLEKRQTPAAIFEHAQDLRFFQDWQVTRCRYRYWARA